MPRKLLPFSLICLTTAALFGAGCQSKYSDIPTYTPATQPVADTGLGQPERFDPIDAVAVVPNGWKAEPQKGSEKHAHQVWLSPTGKTAYGVIHFGLPLPVSATWILGPFLDNMKKSEGEAILVGQPMKDDSLPGVRFVVEGGLYKMRVNLICKGFRGWAVYAGTLRKEEEIPAEIELAERAREKTLVGTPAPTTQPAPPTPQPTAQRPPEFIRPSVSASE